MASVSSFVVATDAVNIVSVGISFTVVTLIVACLAMLDTPPNSSFATALNAFNVPFKFNDGVTDLKSNGGAMLVFMPFEANEETFIKFPFEGVENPEDPIDTVLVVVNVGRVAEIFGASTFGIPAISSGILYFPTNARVLCNAAI